MPEPAPAASRIARLQVRLLPLDLAALSFALLSLLLYVANYTVPLAVEERPWLVWIDYGAIWLFGLLFVGKALASLAPVRYLRTHWFDVVGLLPITQPMFGLDRWWALIGVVIVLARASAALDRAFGERVLAHVIARYRAALVEELTEPILLRLLQILRGALGRGHYMQSIGKKVEERRPEIHEVVRRAVASSAKLSFVTRFERGDRFVKETVDEAVTAAVVALTSEELDRLVHDAIAQAIVDLEAEVAKPAWKEKGYSLADIARGLTRAG